MDKYQGLSISVCGLDQGGQQTIPGDFSLIHEDEQFYVMAVSAGSSGSQYFRSYQGARYAAEAAVNSLKVFASSVTGEMLFAEERTRERMLRQLEGSIIVAWRDKVRRHLAGNPFLPEELEGVEDEKYRNGYRKGTDLEYAYRANIMAAIIARDYCLVIRNGNGQCTVMENARQTEEPVPWNKKCTDSYSTSMCERSALQDFRHYCADQVPAAVLLVTDGMCRCFEEPEEYHGYIEQLMQRALRNSSDAKEYLRVNLPELSRKGSHGDMCLAGVWCPSGLRGVSVPDREREEREREEREREEQARQEELARARREQEEFERIRREQEEQERRRREQEEFARIQREQEELERVRRQQEELERAVQEQGRLEPVTEPGIKRRKRPPVLLMAAAAVAGAVFFLAGSGGSDKKETTAAAATAEQPSEDKPETKSGDDGRESESIRQSLEESIKESLREEMEAQTTEETPEETAEEETTEEETAEETEEETTEETAEETSEEETEPPTTAPPATTAAPRTTAAPPPTTAAPPPTTAAPLPETAPPQTAPPQTEPVPETPPAPPPTAPPETAAAPGQSDLDAALQMLKPLQ